jgi:FtsP/CotA-like multicopper oxidase with cupredoxin domain
VIDRSTGAANHGIDWRFTVGDQMKIRLVNEMDSDHPMHHPFHIHGAGRFRWMAHCHIAEHHESGMMFSFDVDPAARQTVSSA